MDALRYGLSIANNFPNYFFSEIYAPNSTQCAAALRDEYLSTRSNYFGFPISDTISSLY